MAEAIFLGLFVLIIGVSQLVLGVISLKKPIPNDHGASAFCLINSPLFIILGLCWFLAGMGI